MTTPNSEPQTGATAAAHAGYVICTMGRSGSSWLGEVLSSTGKLGSPREYFNPDLFTYDPAISADWKSRIAAILTIGKTPNGIYAAKMFPEHWQEASRSADWPGCLPNLKFVYLTRRDLIGQAISRCRAQQTGQFHALSTKGEPKASAWPPWLLAPLSWERRRKITRFLLRFGLRVPSALRGLPFPSVSYLAYDGKRILEILHGIVSQQARWEAFFARTQIVPLRLVYEDIVTDPQGACSAIAALLGLEEPVEYRPAVVAHRVQRDETTREWRARFLAEYGDPRRMDSLS